MKKLQSPDSHHLQAAIGWLELGNHLEANEELERIAPTLRVHPDVLEIRWEIFAKEKKWVAPQIKIVFQTQKPITRRHGTATYTRLRVRSHFTFLDSTLSPATIVKLAKQYGMSAIALTDFGNLHGAVEFALEAKRAGIKPVFGAELDVGGQALLLHVESAKGYHNLNKLLSLHAKSECDEGSVAAQQRRTMMPERLRVILTG
jgi:DNA polymerase III alpha subunit (gram-positive type)